MKNIMLLATVLIISANVYAKSVKSQYIGLGTGLSSFNDGGVREDANEVLAGSGYKLGHDYEDIGLKLYGGYQFNKLIALEASYTRYGKYNTGINPYKVELNPISFSLSANIGYSFGENDEYRPFVIAGTSLVDFGESGSLKSYNSTSEIAFRVGAGFEYAPKAMNDITFRIAYEGDFYTLKGANPDNRAAFSDEYSQSIYMVYAGASYKF